MDEYDIYIIQKDDTLAGIAGKLRISIEDLVEFHNAHSSSGFITDDEWSLFMRKELFVPRNLTKMRLANP